jgi:hypothetical protein
MAIDTCDERTPGSTEAEVEPVWNRSFLVVDQADAIVFAGELGDDRARSVTRRSHGDDDLDPIRRIPLREH